MENNNTQIGIKPDTIIRTIVLALALLNQLLSAFGYSILPIPDEQVGTFVNTGVTILAAVWNWWKNNSFTKEAVAADSYMESLKKQR